LHHARLLGAKDVLHLHRFNDRERLASLDLFALAHVERRQEARHRAEQIFGKIRRHFLDHVAAELGDVEREHVDEVRRAAGGKPPLPAAPGHLDDPAAPVDRAFEQRLAGLPAADQLTPFALIEISEIASIETVEADRVLAPRDAHHPLLGGKHLRCELPADRTGTVLRLQRRQGSDDCKVLRQARVRGRALEAFRIFLGDEAGRNLAGAETRMLHQRGQEIDIVADPFDDERVQRLHLKADRLLARGLHR
jgi:hypothetical protein